ncbi:hypothetical protein NP493_469g01029 [Ridgeia piscesae]|uniref:Fibronectin type-III domain-containing protein n=1 Tax=Ridgeia piscesae TaxID=27915 RepID=A0AAD9KY76_RIDPI|nr:hypothetical protein NP493_469g01029 [Ridgeia piscesae]
MMESSIFTNVLLVLLINLLREVTLLSPQTDIISLSLVSVYSHGVVVNWSGLDRALVNKCELSYRTKHALQFNILLIQAPINSTIDLGQLQPNTSYEFMMVCYRKKSQEKYTSKQFTFTTSSVDKPPQDDAVNTDTTPTTVTKIKLRKRSSSHDTVLGVLFGLALVLVLSSLCLTTSVSSTGGGDEYNASSSSGENHWR